ncbi:MAG: dihydrodipicolinate reductase [Chloroflexi bacterium]|nr:dihydrodipicolinate reductase [Chloroflexota bacterium]
MSSRLPVIVQGLGPIGRLIVEAALGDPALKVVGAVEIDPDLAGRPLAEVVEGAPRVAIRESVAQAREDARAGGGILLHCTGSHLDRVAPQIEEALRQKLHVVSTCEELTFPHVRHAEIAADLDRLARSAGRTVVATGVNPGFLMDALPASLASISHGITSVSVRRVQDPSRRRVPFQQKVGMGLSPAEWEARRSAGGFGHVGLEESARLLAASLGWTLGDWRHEMVPCRIDGQEQVAGTLETLEGSTADGRSICLHFEANAGADEEFDEIVVDGRPPLTLRFEGGVFGDDATAAAVLRAARVVPNTRRGLVTVLDLPLR